MNLNRQSNPEPLIINNLLNNYMVQQHIQRNELSEDIEKRPSSQDGIYMWLTQRLKPLMFFMTRITVKNINMQFFGAGTYGLLQ